MTESKNENEPEISEATKKSYLDKPDLKGDWLNFFLLLLLYTMQGMIFGLLTAVPILLQSNKYVTYNDQALFSITTWPLSFKILWAPLVDALYIQKIGRRKTWLIPSQFLMGVCFLYIANNITEWLPETGKPNILKLVCVIFVARILAATQDIAVDGWGLTILKRNNIGYASTCQTTGVMTGDVIGSVLPVLLTSENFSNKYLRNTPAVGGIVTLESLFYVWGILFMLITTLIALFKKEKDNTSDDDHVKLNILQNYTLLWEILKLPSVRILAIALLTVPFGILAMYNVSILKLIDAGVTKENIMLIRTSMLGLKILLPLVVAKYTSGPKPLNIYLSATIIKIFWNIIIAILVYYSPILLKHSGVVIVPTYYYVILIFVLWINEILYYIMFITQLAFFSRISDSRFGGIYMTLFCTLANLGKTWTSSVTTGMIDLLTIEECSLDFGNKCTSPGLRQTCEINGGDCVVLTNGYCIEVALCTIIGIIWYFVFKVILKNIQTKDRSHWMVDFEKPVENNDRNVFTIIDKI